MQIYLVGGAVRDQLLRIGSSDRDYVVVGATPEQMLARGFRPVGADFPVFLHPQTSEEYALARTERKSGQGYKGFSFYAAADVTLEQDLSRRDFTFNAIAQAEDGSLVDPFNGVADIQARVIRHVSSAFCEDPLRILRAARFMARFSELGFQIAPQTLELMRSMSASGELSHLVTERVWQELAGALKAKTPSAFLQTLKACHALQHVLPEVDALYGVPQRPEYHPEVDSGRHTELVIDMAAHLAPADLKIGFAALVHDLGKAKTRASALPRHIGHEHAGIGPVKQLCDRLKVPNDCRDLALIACREHLNVHRITELRPDTLHDLVERCDGFRRPELITQLAIVCEADARGREGLQDKPYPQSRYLTQAHAVLQNVRARDLDLSGISGTQVGVELRAQRINALKRWLSD